MRLIIVVVETSRLKLIFVTIEVIAYLGAANRSRAATAERRHRRKETRLDHTETVVLGVAEHTRQEAQEDEGRRLTRRDLALRWTQLRQIWRYPRHFARAVSLLRAEVA